EGRVTRQDVLAYLTSHETSGQSTPESQGGELQPLAPTRKTIAERMSQSAHEIPHAWFTVEVDASALVTWRDQIKAEFQEREGIDLTYLPFAVKAAVEAIKQHPIVNSSWTNAGIMMKREINVGIAVATESGLVVPVV